jgi:hypothetical protein
MTYRVDENTLSAAAGAATTAAFDFDTQGPPGCARTSWSTLDVLVVDSRNDAGLRFAEVAIDGEPLGDFGTIDVAGSPGAQTWHVTGAELTGDFTLTGRIEVDGAGFVGNEAMRVQATVGCLGA